MPILLTRVNEVLWVPHQSDIAALDLHVGTDRDARDERPSSILQDSR